MCDETTTAEGEKEGGERDAENWQSLLAEVADMVFCARTLDLTFGI